MKLWFQVIETKRFKPMELEFQAYGTKVSTT